MNLYSPYQQMTDSAARITEQQNLKLLIRHSIRFDNPVNGDYSTLLLTQEGIDLAKKIGSSIDRPIGICASSKIQRCRQTIEYICEGIDKKFLPEKLSIQEYKSLYGIVGNPAPVEMGGVGWYEYFNYLQLGDVKACHGVTMDMEIKPILDTIFSTGGKPGTLDLFCTHDSHIVVAASALFGLKTGLDGHDWCQYAEGLIFTGSRKDFTVFWRGEEKRFVNYLV